MDKENPNIIKIQTSKDLYGTIKNSRVSWRRKASYRKKVKRLANKLSRLGNKVIIKNLE